MADSRPMSRRGRSRKFPDYEESGLAYSEDILPYSNIDYIKQEEVYYKRDTPVLPERPKTSHGRRQRAPSEEQKQMQPESSGFQVLSFDATQSEDGPKKENWVSEDTYNPELWTDGDTYRSDQWTDADPYLPEQRTETDPYTQDEWTESQEQSMQHKTYDPEPVNRETWDNENQDMWRTPGEQSYGDGLSSSKQYGDFSPRTYTPQMPQTSDTHRPSSKRRQRNRNGKRHSEDIIMQEVNMRPTSSLTKYRPLPSIGSKATKSSHQVENIVSSTSVLSVSDAPRERKHHNSNKASKMSNEPAKMGSAMTDDWPVENDASVPQESHHHKKTYSESQSLVLDNQPLSDQEQPDQPNPQDITPVPAPESQSYRVTKQLANFSEEQFEQNEFLGQQAVESFQQAESLPQFQQYEVQAHQVIQELHQAKQEAIPQFSKVPEKNEAEFLQPELLAHQSVPQLHQARQEAIPQYPSPPEKDDAEFLGHQSVFQFHQGKHESIPQFSKVPEKNEAEFLQPELLAHQSVPQLHQAKQEAIPQYPPGPNKDEAEQPELLGHQSVARFHQARQNAIQQAAEKDQTEHRQKQSHQDNTQVQHTMTVQQETSADVKERVLTEEAKMKETREEKHHQSSALMRKIDKTISEQEQLIEEMSRNTPTARRMADERSHQAEVGHSKRETRRHKAPPSLQSAAKHKKNLRKSKTEAAARNSPPKKGVEFTPHTLSAEPSDKEERILLAVKLPSGQRCQRYFQRSETIDLILKFAENSCSTDLSGYLLVSNMPRVAYESRMQTISDASLKDRTVLYLEEREVIE